MSLRGETYDLILSNFFFLLLKGSAEYKWKKAGDYGLQSVVFKETKTKLKLNQKIRALGISGCVFSQYAFNSLAKYTLGYIV